MAEKRIRNFIFAPPRFLLMPAVGIDISDRSIKYAELIPTSIGHRLGRFGEILLEQGLVENGRIINQSRLTEILANLVKEQKISFVRAALPEEQIYFYQTHLPSGTRESLREAIELGLEDHVPIPVSEAYFDYEIVGSTETETEVVVSVASSIVIQSYADTFKDAGLTLLSLELEAEAETRAVVHNDDKTATLLVDFGRTRTGIAIVHEGKVHFTSTVSVGGQMLTETLTKHFGIPSDQAEAMKREFGMRRNSPHQDLFALLLNNIAVLRDEINKHFTYWHTHKNESGNARPPIEQIVLIGGDSNLAGLSEYLSTSLHVTAVRGDVWTNIELPPKDVPALSKNDSLGYATAIGLALHDTKYE
ncbi:MAG: type IV pilus assembly protein PilM [Candidatus Pacebacteria bacterium]|nr:type IV pilus assembly protein PilM [Candidatus Paceibacterota bacterium]